MTIYYYEAKTPQEQLEFLDYLTKNTTVRWVGNQTPNSYLPAESVFVDPDFEDDEYKEGETDHIVFHIWGSAKDSEIEYLTFSNDFNGHKHSLNSGYFNFDGILEDLGLREYKPYEPLK